MKMTTCFSGAHFTDGVKSSRFKPHPMLMVLIFIVVYIVAQQVIMGTFLGIVQMILLFVFDEKPDVDFTDINSLLNIFSKCSDDFLMWNWVVQLVLTAIPIAAVIFFAKVIERRDVGSLGLTKRCCVRNYVIGMVVGIALTFACYGISYENGGAYYADSPEIKNVAVFVLICIGWLIQGAEEEILFRGWFMSWLSARVPLWSAVLISAAMFSAIHCLSPGFGLLMFVNFMLLGVLFSLIALRFNSVVPCCAAHSLWNLVQGNIFGFRASGFPSGFSVWRFEFVESNTLWSGGTSGIEGSLGCTIILAVAIAVALFIPKKSVNKESDKEVNV